MQTRKNRTMSMPPMVLWYFAILLVASIAVAALTYTHVIDPGTSRYIALQQEKLEDLKGDYQVWESRRLAFVRDAANYAHITKRQDIILQKMQRIAGTIPDHLPPDIAAFLRSH